MSGEPEFIKSGLLSNEEWEEVKNKVPLPHADLVVLKNDETRGQEVLLLKRKTGPWEGTWCLIGGRQRKNESLADLIKRQAAEIGVEVGVIGPFSPNFPATVEDRLNQDSEKQATTLVYPVKIVSGEVVAKSEEVGELKWFPIGNLPSGINPDHESKILNVTQKLAALRARKS